MDGEAKRASLALYQVGMQESWTSGTRDNWVTAVTQFAWWSTVIMKRPVWYWRERDGSIGGNGRQKREALLMVYYCYVTRNHKTVEAGLAVIRIVAKFYRMNGYGDIFVKKPQLILEDLMRGLRRIKDHTRRPREGLSGRDIGCIGERLRQMGRDSGREAIMREAYNMDAATKFGFKTLFRAGEATSRNREYEKGEFQIARRLARGDFTFKKGGVGGEITSVVVKLPWRKTTHTGSQREEVEAYEIFAVRDANWCCVQALYQAFEEVDVVPAELRKSTPAFRRATDVSKGEGGGAPLTGKLLYQKYREIMEKYPEDFDGKDPAKIGGHSLRIGGLMALVEAGADEITLMTLGGWFSDAYKLYIRLMGTEWQKRWQRKQQGLEGEEAGYSKREKRRSGGRRRLGLSLGGQPIQKGTLNPVGRDITSL